MRCRRRGTISTGSKPRIDRRRGKARRGWNGGGRAAYPGPAVSPRDAEIVPAERGALTEGTGPPPRRGLRRLRRALLPLLVLGAAIAAFLAMMATRTAILPEAPGERVWAVEAATVVLETTRPRIPLFGQAVAGRSVDLRPLVAGRVAAVGPDFREGGYVAAGDLLVAIDPFDFETALALRAAELAEARAGLREVEADLAGARDQLGEDRRQLDLLRREAGRKRRLRERGAISQKALDDGELALSRQQQASSQRRNAVARFTARIERQQAAIRRAETALARAKRDLAETRLTSPFAGWLVDIGVEVGKQVGTAERVARLVDASRLEIGVTIPNDIFGALDAGEGVVGRRLEAVWRTGAAARRFPARIVRLGGEIDAASGGITAFASLGALPEDTRLRAGAFVELFLEGPEFRDAVRLPAAAVFDGERVYRIGADDRLEAVEVRVRASEGESLLVQGPLENGQRIVLTRFPEIAAGVRVAVP